MRGIGGVTGGPGRIGRRTGRGAAGFAPGEGTEAAAGAAPAAAAGPVGLGLLAVQEAGERAARDRAARARADSILQELRGLQRDLLSGGGDRGRLERLAALEEGEEGADPNLREAVQAVVLRARVELCRRGWNRVVSTP
ncbi:flagellar assembly protein FliX [Paracraurococcus lichenis]|uniref:Flagellar assembly protein FliX n=1 Tax=Paracraurococcus lichenis TaxID=3064888 RepID=A0ABT9E4R1_9PROT|nr:flagellar assembly protein FliX [Paracraurococcus sp. LOR1-02]MDO9711148.1 flagellar assembly protein FliX [Paracraurococcus sp. LOR1-02]